MQERLIIVSKSPWFPAIRREHAIARLAAEHGHQVTFVESPRDIRGAAAMPASWLLGFHGRPRQNVREGIEVVPRSCVVPQHRNAVAESVERSWLRRGLARELDRGDAVVMMTLPWHVGTVTRRVGDRVILDVADDWTALMPARSSQILKRYRVAEKQTDAVVLASDRLRNRFADSNPQIVRNGVDDDLVIADQTSTPVMGRMTYVGTLSERFDAELLDQALDQLPGHTLELYGPCAYARCGDQPDAALNRLLRRTDGRASWNGPVERARLPGILDASEILLVPNRGSHTRGQDSMKIYDYAARGRPILATFSAVDGISELPPGTYVVDGPEQLAQAARNARLEPESHQHSRRAWAARQTWSARWEILEKIFFPRGGDVRVNAAD